MSHRLLLCFASICGALAACRAPAPARPQLVEIGPTVLEQERARFDPVFEVESVPFPMTGPELVSEGEALSFNAFLGDVWRSKPGPEGPPRQLRVHDRLFRRAPRAVIAPTGEVRLRWTLTRAVLGGRVDYGMRVLGTGLPRRVYRRAAPLRIEGAEGEAELDMRPLFLPRYDVGPGLTGRGVLTVRLRLLDPARGGETFFDLDVPFACDGPCAEGGEVRQLPSFRLGPTVEQVTSDSAIIAIATDVPTAVRVVAIAPDGKRARFDSALAVHHEIPLTGLSADTHYRYVVFAAGAETGTSEAIDGSFVTDGASAFRFAVMSDSRSGVGAPATDYRGVNRAALESLGAQVIARDHRLVMFVGDLISGYTTEPAAYRYELEGFMQSVQPFAARVPYYEVMGNHELVMEAWSTGYMNDRPGPSNTQAVFAELMTNPLNGPDAKEGEPTLSESVYSFDFGPAHFAVVNSNYFYRSDFEDARHPRAGFGYREGWLSEVQLEWLRRDLSSARERGAAHLFVFTHEPAYPAAGHAHDAMYWSGRIPEVLERRDAFWAILVEHGVRAAFFGDEHAYTRTLIDASVNPAWTTPIWHIVTGGAGAPYYGLDRSVPWIGAVKRFLPDTHLCEVEIDGARAYLRVVNDWGEVVDEIDLTRH